ncbi:MAG: acyl-CoA dehydrogenase family protein [Rhodospirillales bacterium]|nr:acyl-CoA dehydrogenase family protein [Rhodospirillales bacterium]
MFEQLTPEDKSVVEVIERFAAEILAPVAHDVDQNGTFVGDHLSRMAELGMMGMNLPEAWGGAGISAQALLASVEAIAGACASTASALTAHFLATDSILFGGNDALRERYLPRAAEGKLLGAFALTEPRAGSNPADMHTRAKRTDSGYHIEGVKHFISNGGVADFIIVFALTSTRGKQKISAFVVDRGTTGLTVGPPEKTMGLRGGHVFELSFDCDIPLENRIGEEGSGFKTAMRVLDNGRLEVAGMCIGIAQAALDHAVSWARERVIGGMPLSDYQGIQWMLADMATQLQAARLLARQAADLRQREERFSQESAMAKLFASEMAGKVTDSALQIHGGYGYTSEMPLERYVRDVRIMRIYEGSSEIQRNIIAGTLLKQEK